MYHIGWLTTRNLNYYPKKNISKTNCNRSSVNDLDIVWMPISNFNAWAIRKSGHTSNRSKWVKNFQIWEFGKRTLKLSLSMNFFELESQFSKWINVRSTNVFILACIDEFPGQGTNELQPQVTHNQQIPGEIESEHKLLNRNAQSSTAYHSLYYKS